jgi:anti-sigma regulatory factor (Ser/Thr protein kinase)
VETVSAPDALPALIQTPQKSFAMTHASEISAARRFSQLLAERAGFAATEAGRLAIAVTEAGTNILKHAADGWLILNTVERDGRRGIEILALDRGPGIANIVQSLRDGVSTAGTAGTGLGAMRRLSDEFDVYSVPEQGVAIYMVILAGRAPQRNGFEDLDMGDQPGPRLSFGAVCLPIVNEEACGDAWGIEQDRRGATVVVADGLGHGPGAAAASEAAIGVLRHDARREPAGLIQAMHEALRPTRGAAAAVMKLDADASTLCFAGIGNITACVIDGDANHQLVSHNGIVGHNMRKVQEFSASWPVGALCILCSDGIGTQWNIVAYPGLLGCHPALIAGVLYRDFMRLRDDATVLVIRRLH